MVFRWYLMLLELCVCDGFRLFLNLVKICEYGLLMMLVSMLSWFWCGILMIILLRLCLVYWLIVVFIIGIMFLVFFSENCFWLMYLVCRNVLKVLVVLSLLRMYFCWVIVGLMCLVLICCLSYFFCLGLRIWVYFMLMWW